jgi:hypothetical protein
MLRVELNIPLEFFVLGSGIPAEKYQEASRNQKHRRRYPHFRPYWVGSPASSFHRQCTLLIDSIPMIPSHKKATRAHAWSSDLPTEPKLTSHREQRTAKRLPSFFFGFIETDWRGRPVTRLSKVARGVAEK